MPDLVFKSLIKEPLIAILRTDHRLAALDAFSPENLVGETFISVANNAPVVRAAIDDYLRWSGFDIAPDHEATSTYMAISLVVSTRGIALLPLYTQNFLPPSVTSRPLEGEAFLIARDPGGCQRRRENASAGRSKTASGWMPKAPTGGLLLGDKQDEKPNCLTRECYRVVGP